MRDVEYHSSKLTSVTAWMGKSERHRRNLKEIQLISPDRFQGHTLVAKPKKHWPNIARQKSKMQ